MNNFWKALPKPLFALAPLEDVTDAAFRRLIAKFGKPDVMFTEFTSADGLVLADEKGQKRLRKKLLYSETERPIVAQLFTSLPEHMAKATALVAEEPAAITIHARTRKEMSDVPARWETIERAVAIRDSLGSQTLIIGNGDVKDIADARAKVAETKCDGVMLGRAIFGNPWLFSNSQEFRNKPEYLLHALVEHLQFFDELLSYATPFATMKKHFKSYVSDWSGAKELRMQLMKISTVDEARRFVLSELEY